MWHGPERRRGISLAMMRRTPAATPTEMESVTATPIRRRSASLRKMGLGCTTCMAMLGNAWETAGTTATRGRRRTARPGPRAIAVSVCFAAVPGATARGICARRSATGTSPLSGTTSTASGSGERLRLDSLDIYLCGCSTASKNFAAKEEALGKLKFDKLAISAFCFPSNI